MSQPGVRMHCSTFLVAGIADDTASDRLYLRPDNIRRTTKCTTSCMVGRSIHIMTGNTVDRRTGDQIITGAQDRITRVTVQNIADTASMAGGAAGIRSGHGSMHCIPSGLRIVTPGTVCPGV